METLRARVTIFKKRFLQKVWSFNVKINDADRPHITTKLTVFLPKITTAHKIPSIFFHMQNGNGSVYCRVANPLLLADKFDELSKILRSNKTLDDWNYLNYISDKILNNEDIINDPDFIHETFLNEQINA